MQLDCLTKTMERMPPLRVWDADFSRKLYILPLRGWRIVACKTDAAGQCGLQACDERSLSLQAIP